MKKHKRPQSVGPVAVKFVAGFLAFFIVYRLIVLAPHILPRLAGFSVVGFIIVKIYKKFSVVIFPVCPGCGIAMDGEGGGKQVVFRGAENVDGGKPFSAIAVYVSQCPKCHSLHYKLSGANLVKGDGSDRTWMRPYSIQSYGNEMPCKEGLLNTMVANKISELEYQSIVKRLKREVRQNNRNAGFADNPQDIRL